MLGVALLGVGGWRAHLGLLGVSTLLGWVVRLTGLLLSG
jgi:hypothetical protein